MQTNLIAEKEHNFSNQEKLKKENQNLEDRLKQKQQEISQLKECTFILKKKIIYLKEKNEKKLELIFNYSERKPQIYLIKFERCLSQQKELTSSIDSHNVKFL